MEQSNLMTEEQEIEYARAVAYAKERSDKYFMENLHFMFNRPNLLSKNGKDGSPFADAMLRKEDPSEDKEIESILERLRDLFHSFSMPPSIEISSKGVLFHGGGMNLMQLKRKIRERVKQIKPR